jgi:excisionase family DNA binding protein
MRVKNYNSDVLNAKEAAAFLKAHVETIRRLARRGEIPAFKVGKDWRFHQDALRRWSEEQNPRT